MSSSSRAPLADVSAPLPDLNGDSAAPRSLLSSASFWLGELLSRHSTAFSSDVNADGSTKPFSVAQCCNWGNIRTRLLLMCALDVFGSLYGLASANRVRLISPLLNFTGLVFMWMLVIGMAITAMGIVGILQVRWSDTIRPSPAQLGSQFSSASCSCADSIARSLS